MNSPDTLPSRLPSNPTPVAPAAFPAQPTPDSATAQTDSNYSASSQAFDQAVILQPAPLWSRAITWGIVGVTTFSILWAATAKIEEAVPARGKLQPQNKVQAVQAPVNGVVTAIYIKDGQVVRSGDVLFRLDPTVAQAQQRSLQQIRDSLIQENQFYRAELTNTTFLNPGISAAGGSLRLPAEIVALTQNRSALLAESQLYQAQMQSSTQRIYLNPAQQTRLQMNQAETASRIAAAELEVQQLRQQLIEIGIQLANAKQILKSNQEILADVEPLLKEGALPRIQISRQRQDVQTRESEVEQLIQQQRRLELAIAQAQARLQNTTAGIQTDLLNKLAENTKQIANIDSQINKAIVENEKKIAEIDGQLRQTDVTLQYQQVRAPIAGTVFDLQATSPGFVVTSNAPLLKIVPNDALAAEVFITNRDIGFVKEGMLVDVRIDSFPFSEFGDIKGTLAQIGSDALPPDNVYPFYRFPATIRLDRQMISVNDREISLQSGMAVSANIRVRQRTVLSIFTDLFSNKLESLTTGR